MLLLTSGVIAGTVIGGYGMMSGLGTSTIRAVLMFSFYCSDSGLEGAMIRCLLWDCPPL